MNIEMLTRFFMWCTIINGALFAFSTIMLMSIPGLAYRIQSKFFPITRETFDIVIYSFLGLFKIMFLFFNVVPWVALLIIG